MKKLSTQEQWINKANLVHSGKYDYSLVEYKNTHTKVKIVCPEHGVFEQTPNCHVIKSHKCPQCAKVLLHNNQVLDTDSFIKKANLVHSGKYDYSLVEYKNSRTKVKIVCPEHGVFEQTPNCHLNLRQNCPKCSIEILANNNSLDTDSFIKKANLVHNNKYDYSLVNYLHNKAKIKIICPDHGTFEQAPNNHLQGQSCPKCNSNCSSVEYELANFLERNKISYTHKVRNLVSGFELDLFLPDYNLGIEYNGLYWHSELFKDKNYHLNKYLACKEKGINLIQIFEDEWIHKKDIVISVLKQKLNLNINKLYARKCKIKEIDSKLYNYFLNSNHLQGISYNSKIKLGLFYQDNLVAVMGFGRPSLSGGNKSYEWSLDRFAILQNYVVAGGFSKLLKYFVKIYNPKSLVTSADLRYSVGDVYLKNGFSLSHQTKPNYWYFKTGYKPIRYHRFNYRKSVLSEKLESYKSELTEKENMKNNKWLRIYDCGNLIFNYTRS